MFTRGMIFPGGREPILQGDGVLLRYPQMFDYAQWSKLRDESREFLAPWEPTWAADELTRGAFRRRLRRYQREIRGDLAYPFLLFQRPDDLLMGGCTLCCLSFLACWDCTGWKRPASPKTSLRAACFSRSDFARRAGRGAISRS